MLVLKVFMLSLENLRITHDLDTKILRKQAAEMAKLSVNKALLRAGYHAKKGEIEEAQKLYKDVLKAFPKNKRAQQGLDALNKPKRPNATQSPSHEKINQLVNLYNQGQLAAVVTQANMLTVLYPDAFMIWNILGVAAAQTGKMDKAINAFQRVIAIKPDYAEGYYNMGNALKDQGKLDEAIDSYEQALSLKHDYAEVYNNVGVILMDQGKPDEAIASYNKALSIKPHYVEAYYNMGNALKDQGKLDEAIASYQKAVSLKPDHAEACHLLSSLTGKTTNSAPREYVENLFDGYASKFDQSLVVDLLYDLPEVVTQLAVEKHGSGSLGSILDLGCGTGLIGEKIRAHCTYLEGIDLSRKMLLLAKSKNVYDKLGHVDIVGYLSNAELDFDYFIATDVFVYVGELSDVFRLIKARNKKPGKLIFSTEHTKEEGFHLEKSGRYSHSKSYIEGLCKEFKFVISHFSTTNLRKAKGAFLVGGLYILDF